VSEENVEILRGIYNEWATGNVKAGVELLDPHIVYVNRPGVFEVVTCYGLNEMQQWMRGFLSAWREYEAHATEFIPAGDSVVVAVRQTALGIDSGVPVEFNVFHLWTFRGAKIIRLETIADRAEALEAAGLHE
jgi:ketosteroid isomerase-like protein